MRIEITVEGQEPVTHKLVKEKTLLGAGQDCDIVIEAEGVSRKHLVILAEGDQFFVVDQGSTNGAFINEERLVPGQRASFTSFFPVRLGGHVTLALLSDEEGSKTFDFAKDLSPADKSKPGRTSPIISTSESKQPAQGRTNFGGAAPKSPARTDRSGKDKKKSPKQAEQSQSQLVKIIAFVVAFGGSALFFYMKENSSEDTVPVNAVVTEQAKVPEVKLSDFEFKPLVPRGLENAFGSASQLKCSTEEEALFCKGFGLPFQGFGLSGVIFTDTSVTLVLPMLRGDEVVSFFEKDATWDDAIKAKIMSNQDSRFLAAMFVLNSPLEVWTRLNPEKLWLYVLFVNSSGAQEGDVWVGSLSYFKSLAPTPEEFYNLQRSFRAVGLNSATSVAGLFRLVPKPQDAPAP